MAADPQDRENLLRDATAYVDRIQLQLIGDEKPEVIFVGFRRDGAASFFFDQDPVYHFNASRELRRAFINDCIIKAESGRLVRWNRQRTDHEVAMLRDKLSDDEQEAQIGLALRKLASLQEAISTGACLLDGTVSAVKGESPINQVMAFLEQVTEIKIASSARVTG